MTKKLKKKFTQKDFERYNEQNRPDMWILWTVFICYLIWAAKAILEGL